MGGHILISTSFSKAVALKEVTGIKAVQSTQRNGWTRLRNQLKVLMVDSDQQHKVSNTQSNRWTRLRKQSKIFMVASKQQYKKCVRQQVDEHPINQGTEVMNLYHFTVLECSWSGKLHYNGIFKKCNVCQIAYIEK